MQTRNRSLSTRLRSPIDPVVLARKLARSLGLSLESANPAALVDLPFPSISSPFFREEYLMKEVLRKYPGFNLGIDTQSVALEGFLAQEELNRRTNLRLLDSSAGKASVRFIFNAAARKVIQVLGAWSDDDFADGFRFGPGATTGRRGRETTLPWKLCRPPEVTARAADLGYQCITERPHWAFTLATEICPERTLVVRDSDRITFVPKSAKTDRLIAIQPDLNVAMQLAVAYAMRKRMHRWGINLNDQSVNQSRALRGSETGYLATVDLSNASNSMTRSLVWQMVGNHPQLASSPFDPKWFEILDLLRTERGELPDGSFHHYELFSAMGNGYTFELESLIFWALSVATCERLGVPPDVSVYGDDIILPSMAVPLLEEVLSFSGFAFNRGKTHFEASGSIFRESCGMHYLDGIDVTPFYVDGSLDSIDEAVLLANNIKRWAALPWGLDGRLEELYHWVVGHLPDWVRKTAIPFSEANDGLIKDFDEACPSTNRFPGVKYFTEVASDGSFLRVPRTLPPLCSGYRARCFTHQARQSKLGGGAGLAVWLYQRSYQRFQPPSGGGLSALVKQIPSLAARGPGDYGGRDSPPYRVNEFRKSYNRKERIVAVWNDTGPWLS